MRLRSLFVLPSALLSVTAVSTTLSNSTLLSLPGPGNDFDIHNGAILSPILIPRVPGTPGQAAVQNHLVSFFKTHLPKWRLELHNSTSKTPLSGGKELPFVNIIATRDPPWTKDGEVQRLALVAHYDSKSTPAGFIGATDSAAPVAMILHTVRSLDEALTRKWEAAGAEGGSGLDDDEEEGGVQVLLLDGEEAFLTWTRTDSLYGARALAETWENTMHPAMSTYHNPLSSISLFLLLDLLGAKGPHVPSYFKTTHWAYQMMAELETRLRSLGQFKSSPNHPSKLPKQRLAEPMFLYEGEKDTGVASNWLGGYIEDDHVPFMARGVEVLHLIPSPFPTVWHEIEDDGEHLDMETVEDWTKLVMAFVSEWMGLEGFIVQMAHRGDGESEVLDRRKDGVEGDRSELDYEL